MWYLPAEATPKKPTAPIVALAAATFKAFVAMLAVTFASTFGYFRTSKVGSFLLLFGVHLFCLCGKQSNGHLPNLLNSMICFHLGVKTYHKPKLVRSSSI